MADELQYDVLIIGGGAVGCAVARELARYHCAIALVEQSADVASGASGRNSAVVHAGFNNPPGSLMAQLCVEGNRGFEALCQELDVPYKKPASCSWPSTWRIWRPSSSSWPKGSATAATA